MDPDHAYILIGLCPQLLWSCVWGRTYMLLSHSQIWVTSRFWDWLSHLNNQLSKTTQFSHKSNPKYPLSHQRSFLDSWPCSHMQMCIALCTYWKVFSTVVLFDPHKSSCRYGQIIFLFSLMKNWGHREGQSIVLLKTNAGLETRSILNFITSTKSLLWYEATVTGSGEDGYRGGLSFSLPHLRCKGGEGDRSWGQGTQLRQAGFFTHRKCETLNVYCFSY